MNRFYYQRFPVTKAKQKGAMSLEVALVLPILLALSISCFDLVRLLLIRVSLDNALAEASRQVKLSAPSTGNFDQYLLDALKRQPFVPIQHSKLNVTKVNFFATPEHLANNTSTSRGSLKQPLAQYVLAYSVTSLSPWLGTFNFDTQVVVKHEN